MPTAYAIVRQPTELSREKSWFLGHLAGDGIFSRPRGSYRVDVAAGLDRDIADYCVHLFDDIYGATSKIVPQLPGKATTEPKANKTLAMAVKVRALRLYGRSWAETAREIGTDTGTAGKSLRTAIERGWIDPLPKTPSDSVGSGEEGIS